MLQNIIVILIIAAAVAYALFSAIKRFNGKRKNKDCEGCSSDCDADCPIKDLKKTQNK